MAVVYLASRLTHTIYISAGEVLGRLRAHAAMCALRIDELCQYATEVLLLIFVLTQSDALAPNRASERLNLLPKNPATKNTVTHKAAA